MTHLDAPFALSLLCTAPAGISSLLPLTPRASCVLSCPQMRGAPEARRTCLKHAGFTSTPTPPRTVASTSLTEEQLQRCRKFGFACW